MDPSDLKHQVQWPVALFLDIAKEDLKKNSPRKVCENISKIISKHQPTELFGADETIYALTTTIHYSPVKVHLLEAVLLLLFTNINCSSSANNLKLCTKAWTVFLPMAYTYVTCCIAHDDLIDPYYLQYALLSIINE